MSGFSGYRSGGWLVHLAFSAVLVAVTALAFEHLLRLPLWAGYAAAVPVVVAGWGAGAMLGRPEPGFLFIAAILAMLVAMAVPVLLIALIEAFLLHGLLQWLLPRVVEPVSRSGVVRATPLQDPFYTAVERVAEASRTGARRLSLSNLDLELLPPAFRELKGLRELDLGDNQLRELPATIQGLPALLRLRVARNPRLLELPRWIGALRELRELDAEWCRIESLPDELFGLPKLATLRLRGNGLRALPAGLERLVALKHLDVRDNPLDEAHLREVASRLKGVKIRATARATVAA